MNLEIYDALTVTSKRFGTVRIGYARVSTDDQTLDLRAKCRHTYEEHASGKNTVRPELDGCLKALRKGDTLVVWRLDRLGRSLRDLIQLTQDLQGRGIGLESLTEKIGLRACGRATFQYRPTLASADTTIGFRPNGTW